jgi:hypothetical protein
MRWIVVAWQRHHHGARFMMNSGFQPNRFSKPRCMHFSFVLCSGHGTGWESGGQRPHGMWRLLSTIPWLLVLFC